MTTASFFKENGNFCRFRISGHSGYGTEGNDIVCAAVSAMAILTINNITDSFGIPAKVKTDEEGAFMELVLETADERGYALIAGLERELSVLATDYPKFVRVNVK